MTDLTERECLKLQIDWFRLALPLTFYDHKYEVITLLFEESGAGNNALIRQMDAEPESASDVDTIIYSRMINTILEEAVNNPSLMETYITWYRKRYNEIDKELKRIDKQILLGTMSPDDYWREAWEEYLVDAQQIIEDGDPLPSIKYSITGMKLCSYEILRDASDGILSLIRIQVNAFEKGSQFAAEENRDPKKLESLYADITFEDGTDVFSSKNYTRWVEKRKTALAEYINNNWDCKYGASADNLEDVLHEIYEDALRISYDMDADKNPGSVVGLSVLNTMLRHHYPFLWLQRTTYWGDYQPDTEAILNDYFRSRIRYEYYKVQEDSFTRMYMLRYMEEDPKADFVAIFHMYYEDLLCRILYKMEREYYKNYSLDNTVGLAVTERYKRIVEELQSRNTELNTRNTLLVNELQATKANTSKNSKEIIHSYEVQYEKLQKQVAAKEAEIEEYRAQMRSLEEYMLHIQNGEQENSTTAFDLTYLQGFRYLFVGKILEVMPQLRQQFYNSIFMDSVADNLQGIKADYIVFLTKYMSHKMYYKVKSCAEFDGIPIIYYNGKSRDGLLSSLSSGIA